MSTIPTEFDPKNLGWRFFFYLPQFVRLFWRLFKDQRVSFLPKTLLVLALGYVVVPFDLIPDMVWLIGEMDDLAIVVLACRTFLSLCPEDVVEEHVRAISKRS